MVYLRSRRDNNGMVETDRDLTVMSKDCVTSVTNVGPFSSLSFSRVCLSRRVGTNRGNHGGPEEVEIRREKTEEGKFTRDRGVPTTS